MLVVEDVHWADHPTRDLLSFLVRNLRHAAVLLVVTFRSAELHRTHPLRPLLAGLSRMAGVTRLELPRLSRGQVAAQLEGVLGRPPEPAVTNAVYERGGGNPLFTEALVSADGAVSPGVPWSLRDQLLATVKELPEQTQQVLRAAAAGGLRVGHELLAAVTGLDDTALAAALRPAVDANVVIADADGYSFRHDLIRRAVWEDLLPGERARAERAFAEALEAGPALDAGGMVPVRLALHWRGANEHDRALRAAWAAAAGAAGRFAVTEQLQMLEQVLQLWDRVPIAAEHTGTNRAGVVELAADAARWAGEPDRGLTLVEAALGEPGEAGDPGRRASLLLRRAMLRQQALLPGPVDDLQTALRLARSPDRVRAEILGQLSRALWLRGRDEEAKRAAEELTALARRLGDQEYQAEALMALAQIDAREGHDVIAALLGARETARRIGSVQLEMRACAGITHVLQGRGDHERAIQAGREALARARQLGLARFAATPIGLNLAGSLTSAGRWDEALETIEEALGLDPAAEGRAYLLLLRGWIAVARGEHDTAAHIIRQLRPPPADAQGGAQGATQLTLLIAWLAAEARLAHGDLAGALAATRTACAQHMDAEPHYLWLLLATGMRACAKARLCPAAARTRRPGRAAVGAGAGGGGHPAPGPGRAGPRGGLRRRGLPRRGSPGPGRLGRRRRGLGITRPAVPAGLRAAARRGRRRGGRRPGRRGLPAAAGGRTRRPAPRPSAAGTDHPAGAAGARGDHRNQPSWPGRAVRADRTRAGGAAAGRGRTWQPRDRRRAVHLAQDRQRARVQHPRQARRRLPRRGRRHRAPPAHLRPTLSS